MQRRLELACALVHEPELIILDEPTAGIDPLLRGSIWDELHALRDAGRTLLVTTQHVSEADECDLVAMIVGGRIIALAPPDELRRLATDGDLLDIETTREQRLSFDEIFAILVSRNEQEREAEDAEAAASGESAA